MAENKTTLSKTQKVILSIVIVLVLAVGVLTTIFSHRAESVPHNPDGTVGNLAGNINNGGLFAECDGKVYFANSFAGDSLYSMNVDETEMTKVSDAQAVNILAAGNYIYYFQKGVSGNQGLGSVRVPYAFIRSHTDGNKASSLVRNVVVYGQLLNDTLFLMGYDDDENLTFFRIQTDKTEELKLADYTINPASVSGDRIYYNGTVNDHYLYSLNPATNSSSLVLEEDMWYPIVEGGYVYYLDLRNDYQLRRYSFSTGVVEILSEERISEYNVGYGYIYYQTMGDDPHLSVMRSDGSDPRVIASGVYTNLNLTSRYLYFKDFFTEGYTYHSPLGTGSYGVFDAAKDAASELVTE
ncbi:MAG: DUF5050 domain-containing protein [Lachnospiraceae bacterium]|nr:DUF5050 domain-containing protein [Lachnospiraceae bacterium]